MPRAPNPDLPRRLLEAALALLDERGEADLGLREVAGRTGYTVTAIYRCFGSRAGLLDALRARLAAGLGLHVGVPQDGPIDESLCEFAHRFVRWAVDHPARFRLLFAATPTATTSPGRAAIGAIENALSRAAHRGEIAATDPHLFARTFMAATVGLTVLTLADDAGDRGPGRWTDAYLAPVVASILR